MANPHPGGGPATVSCSTLRCLETLLVSRTPAEGWVLSPFSTHSGDDLASLQALRTAPGGEEDGGIDGGEENILYRGMAALVNYFAEDRVTFMWMSRTCMMDCKSEFQGHASAKAGGPIFDWWYQVCHRLQEEWKGAWDSHPNRH